MLEFIHWTVNPDLISEPLTIRWYGLLFATGFFIGFQLLKYTLKKEGESTEWTDSILIYMVIGTVVGARLGHVFFYDWPYYKNHLSEIPMVWKGGLASHGGAIGIILAMFIFSKFVIKKNVLWILDRIVMPIAFAGILIRLGNLMNHEIVGNPSNLPWAFIFHGHPTFENPDLIPRHPAQLYEALCYIISFLTLFFLIFKKNTLQKTGTTFGWFLILIFTFRFLIEFVKEDQEMYDMAIALNTGQLLSIPFVLLGIYFAFVKK